jgi:hypothetical protein
MTISSKASSSSSSSSEDARFYYRFMSPRQRANTNMSTRTSILSLTSIDSDDNDLSAADGYSVV